MKDWYHGKKAGRLLWAKTVQIWDKFLGWLNVIVVMGIEIGAGAVVGGASIVKMRVPRGQLPQAIRQE